MVGYFQLRAAKTYLLEKIALLNEFRNKFIQLANSVRFEHRFGNVDNIDSEIYIWLTLNATKIQRSIGRYGVVDYIAPFQMYKATNYQVIVNTLPKFRSNNLMYDDITMADDALLRGIGIFHEFHEKAERDSKNPIKWFQAGFKYILSLPFKLLTWFGLVSEEKIDSIIGSSIYKFISGLIGLIGFFSAIVTITTGWESFIKIVKSISN